MRSRALLKLLPFLCAAFLPVASHGQSQGPGASLDAVLRPYLARFDLPAVAVAIVKKGEVVASGAVGTRRVGADIPVSVHDRFHIGSDTKAMTSLIAAMLVEGGKISWSTTVSEAFPELAGNMDQGVRGVTLEQLLSHTSGIPSDTAAHEKLIQSSFALEKRNLDELRYWIIQQLVAEPLQSEPGKQFAYSNMGYMLAGAMLERASGETWEELIALRLFDALSLKSAGLGPQSTLGRVDAPLGHEPRDGQRPKPLLAGPGGDNPEVIGPAGTAHMSVLDFARWAGWNAGSGRRDPPLVNPETVRKLHTPTIEMPPRPDAAPGTPAAGSYGFGWLTTRMPFSREAFLFHGGSNEMNLAAIFVQPKHDFGMVLMTNIGGRRADDGLKALAAELYRSFGPEPVNE
jgi:CubicO group peptidase (beta-lactamase class C family)